MFEPNITLIFLGIAIATWPVVFVILLIYDAIKGNKFRPGYRAAWPIIMALGLAGESI